MATETSVQVFRNQDTVQGQAQSGPLEPHDGRHFVDEVRVVTDRVIVDVNDPLAVQVPEGVGASTAGHYSPMGQALERGTPEQQLVDSDEPVQVDPEANTATETGVPEVSGTTSAPEPEAAPSETPAS